MPIVPPEMLKKLQKDPEFLKQIREGPISPIFQNSLMELIMPELKTTPHMPILCLDFDGVIHSYSSGWKGADVVSDPPVPGALEFIEKAIEKFEIHIFSSRSNQEGGVATMQLWLEQQYLKRGKMEDCGDEDRFDALIYDIIKWPTAKPPAMLTIDDRAICFNGTWPDVDVLLAFQPWNKGTHIIKKLNDIPMVAVGMTANGEWKTVYYTMYDDDRDYLDQDELGFDRQDAVVHVELIERASTTYDPVEGEVAREYHSSWK